MKRLTALAAALLVVLAGYGLAGAATLTLTIDVADTTLAVGEETTYTVYGLITDNTTDDGFGNVLNGGFASAMIDQIYTSGDGGAIRHKQGFPATPTNYTPNPLTINTTVFNGNTSKGNVVDGSGTPTYQGTGGVDNTYMARTPWSEPYDYFNSGPAAYQQGNGTAVVLYTGTIQAVTDGLVDIVVDRQENTGLVYKITGGAGLFVEAVDTCIPGTAKIQVGEVTTGNPPTVGITTADIVEGDWTGPSGWCNADRTVSINAVGSDEDGGTQVLTWLWEVNDGTGYKTVGSSADSLALTIQALIDAGCTLPDPITDGADHSTDPAYQWDLRVTVTDPDGSASDTMKIFVPEPTTIGLLGFGVVALLRRRRA